MAQRGRCPWTLLWLTIMAAVWLQRTVDGAGCIFLRDDLSIRCQNASLPDVRESLHVLTTVVQNRPRTIDIDDCSGARELPLIFGFIKVSNQRSPPSSDIDTVRVRRSGLRSLHPDVFLPLSRTLRDLDLSHNYLRSVPDAIRTLHRLEHLSLQHNRIVFLRPGAALDGIPRLRELNLAHNYIGQAMDPGDGPGAERHGYQLKASLKLEDFSLGRAGRSLESLNLRGNRLAAVPRQISEHGLPELRHLDVSENVIGRPDDLTDVLLPKLEFLDLQSNRIQSISESGLPRILKYLDLTENPYNCECSALWLYNWYKTNASNIRLPTCNVPDKFKGKKLNHVPWSEQCEEDNSTLKLGYQPKGLRHYDVLRLTTTADSITIAWGVEDPHPSPDRHWAVVYRRSTDSPHQMTLVTPKRTDQLHPETLWTQTITGLQEFTGYVICVAVVNNGKYTIEPSKCRQATTKDSQTDSIWNKQNTSSFDVETSLDDVTVSATAITIKWRLTLLDDDDQWGDHSLRHEWTIRIRRTGSDNYTDIPVYDITTAEEANGQMYEYGISDLSARTHYDVCLVDVEHRPISDRMTAMPMSSVQQKTKSVNESTSCVTVQTGSNHMLYATEIAAIALACSIAFIVSALTLFLCRQKRLLKWKPKKLKKWFAVGCKQRPGGHSSRYATATIPRLRCELAGKDSERCIVGTWNTLRMPYKDFPQVEDTEEVSARGYKDALTSVTIYKSGYSEC